MNVTASLPLLRGDPSSPLRCILKCKLCQNPLYSFRQSSVSGCSAFWTLRMKCQIKPGETSRKEKVKERQLQMLLSPLSICCQESLAYLWSILFLPTCSEVSKILPLALEEKKFVFRSSFDQQSEQ